MSIIKDKLLGFRDEGSCNGRNGKGIYRNKRKGAGPGSQETKWTWVRAGLQQRSLAVDYVNALERIKELEVEKKALALELQLAEDLVGMS